MKTSLSYLVFALVATTSSFAFARTVASPCAVPCAEDEICEFLPVNCACLNDDGEGENPCECDAEAEEAVCVPAPPAACDSDSDCNSDDVCVTYTYASCSGGAVAPPCGPDDQECDPAPAPEPDPCTEESESICVPQYAAPCDAAQDCGAGFTCETPEICTCTTSAGASIACEEGDPDCEDLPPREDDCSCEPSEGDAYCRLIEVECLTDDECGEGVSCEPVNGEYARPEINCDNDGCESLPVPTYCIPDGYVDWVSNGGTDHTDGRKAESAKRNNFFNPAQTGDTGSKSSPDCSVSQGPKGFAAGALMLFAMMFGFRRKK